MKSIKVAAAVIEKDGRIFATQRGYGPYKDWWEFPGGKIEAGETPEEALVREIREELDTEISVGDLLMTVEYDYPEFHLSMDCFMCEVVSGDLTLREHESAKFLPVDDMWQVKWLPADIRVVEAIEARGAAEAMSRADTAEYLFRQGFNCAQSVFASFADVMGMTVPEAAQLASPFGAGFGKLREVCGAVSGMTMAAGRLTGYSDPCDHEGKKALYALEREMCAEFEAEMGTIICREMLGLEKGEDIGEPSVRTEEYYQSRPCIRACRTAAEIAGKYLLKADD